MFNPRSMIRWWSSSTSTSIIWWCGWLHFFGGEWSACSFISQNFMSSVVIISCRGSMSVIFRKIRSFLNFITGSLLLLLLLREVCCFWSHARSRSLRKWCRRSNIVQSIPRFLNIFILNSKARRWFRIVISIRFSISWWSQLFIARWSWSIFWFL